MRFLGIILFSVIGFNISAQCTKDIECKGDRICIEGKCVFPDDIENPTSQTESEAPIITKLSDEQKKRIARALIFNSVSPFINMGHHYNGDHIIGASFTAATVIPFSATLINFLVKQSVGVTYSSTDTVKTTAQLEYEKATTLIIAVNGVVVPTIHTVSTIIAGI